MKNICKKIFGVVLCIVLFWVIICGYKCFALSDVTNNFFWESWVPTVEADDGLSNKIGPIIGVIRTLGIIVSVVTLSVIGIKIMLGSVEEKANYKQVLTPWIIGATMVFAITMIPTLIYDITSSALSESTHGDGSYLNGLDDAMKWIVTLEGNSDWISIAEERYINRNNSSVNNNDYWKGYTDGILKATDIYADAFGITYAKGYISIIDKIESGEITEENFNEKSLPYEKALLQSLKNGKSNNAEYDYCYGQVYRLHLQEEKEWENTHISNELEDWVLLISGWDDAIDLADSILTSRGLPYDNEEVSTTIETRRKYKDTIYEIENIFVSVSLTEYGHGIWAALDTLERQEYWQGYFIKGYQSAVHSLASGAVTKENIEERIETLENVALRIELRAGEEAGLKGAHQYRTWIMRLKDQKITWKMEEEYRKNHEN